MVELARTFGEGPYPFPVDRVNDFFEVYESDSTLILDPKLFMKFDLFPGSHDHSDYELLIPYMPLEYVGVDRKKINLHPKQILLIHSKEPHGPVELMNQVRFLSISLEKNFVQKIGELLFSSKEIMFQNQAITLTLELEALIHQFMQEFQAKQMGYPMILECLSSQFLISLFRQACPFKEEFVSVRISLDSHVEKAIEMLQDCYNRDYTLEEVAKIANLSPYHFIRVFKSQTGKTPFAFLLDIKLNRAREMLQNKKLSITEVSYSSGFKSTSHFATVFKKKYGASPSEYRTQI